MRQPRVRAEVSVCSGAIFVLAVAASICGAGTWTNPIVRRAPTVGIPWSPAGMVCSPGVARSRESSRASSFALVDILDRRVMGRGGGGV